MSTEHRGDQAVGSWSVAALPSFIPLLCFLALRAPLADFRAAFRAALRALFFSLRAAFFAALSAERRKSQHVKT